MTVSGTATNQRKRQPKSRNCCPNSNRKLTNTNSDSTKPAPRMSSFKSTVNHKKMLYVQKKTKTNIYKIPSCNSAKNSKYLLTAKSNLKHSLPRPPKN